MVVGNDGESLYHKAGEFIRGLAASVNDDRSARIVRRKRGLIACAAGLVLLFGTSVYAFANSLPCADGTLPLNVWVAPEMAPAVAVTAKAFDRDDHKVAGRCVRAAVRPVEPVRVSDLLSGRTPATDLGGRPDVWIPDTSLWVDLLPPAATRTVRLTDTSAGRTPLVVGLPRAAASAPGIRPYAVTPTWSGLLAAAGSGQPSQVPALPAEQISLHVPDPTTTGSGLAMAMLIRALVAGGPDANVAFTGAVRTIRQFVTRHVAPAIAVTSRKHAGRWPVGVVTEQALWRYDTAHRAAPVVALYPAEGTLALDYPLVVTTGAADRQRAAGAFEQAMTTDAAGAHARALGFRTVTGPAPAAFAAAGAGVDARAPLTFSPPGPADVRATMQAWLRLTLVSRVLNLLDISGSMGERVPGTNLTRIQALAQVSQQGLAVEPDDTQMGVWTFSTDLVGRRPWREDVPLGPLGDQIGSMTRRQLILRGLAALRAKPHGETGLYQTVLDAFRYMMDTYRPDMVNAVLLQTDGKNNDPKGPTLAQTLAALKKEYDPLRPVQVVMIGFGKGVDSAALGQIARVTHGSVYIAQTPGDIARILREATSRRICFPKC